MDYNVTKTLIDIDVTLGKINDSIKDSIPRSKADFIRKVAPEIALTIAPNQKVDFSFVIQMAATWHDEIEKYIKENNC